MFITPKSAYTSIKEISGKVPRSNFLEMTPPLPLIWPPNAEGFVIYYLYELILLPTSTIQYEIRSPSYKAILCVTKNKAEPSLKNIKGGNKLLGTTELKNSSDDTYENRLEQAKVVLFKLVSGKSHLSSESKEVLKVYLDYIDLNPLIGDELKNRCSKFFTWLYEKNDVVD